MQAPSVPSWTVRLEVQLQSELDLPRIVRSIAGCANFAKVGTGKVGRTTDGYNSIATEAGSVEVRVIQDVKELRTEFQELFFKGMESLHDGEIDIDHLGPPENVSAGVPEA